MLGIHSKLVREIAKQNRTIAKLGCNSVSIVTNDVHDERSMDNK